QYLPLFPSRKSAPNRMKRSKRKQGRQVLRYDARALCSRFFSPKKFFLNVEIRPKARTAKRELQTGWSRLHNPQTMFVEADFHSTKFAPNPLVHLGCVVPSAMTRFEVRSVRHPRELHLDTAEIRVG